MRAEATGTSRMQVLSGVGSKMGREAGSRINRSEFCLERPQRHFVCPLKHLGKNMKVTSFVTTPNLGTGLRSDHESVGNK